MGRKNSPSAKKELVTLITNYEEAKAENRQLYLDADQLAGIADWYASERKFEEAQEVITYGLKIHPRNTDLLIEQAYLYLDTQKLQKAKKVADSITEEFDSEVKLLKAELLLNGGKLEEAQWLLSTIADADELETIIDVVFLYLDMGYPDAAKEWLAKKGMEAMDGPVNFGSRDTWWGLLVEGYEFQPLYANPYNPPYYKELFERYGFRNYFNQNTYIWRVNDSEANRQIFARTERLMATPGYRFENIDMRNLEEAAENFRIIYNKAWALFSGVKPMDKAQAQQIMRSIKPIIDPNIIIFAYFNDEPIGFFITVPDLNRLIGKFNGKLGWWQKLRLMWDLKVRKSCDRIFGIIFGITPEFHGKGVESGIMTKYWHFLEESQSRYKTMELAWIGDFNPVMNRMIQTYVCASLHKVHTTYRYLFDREKEFHRCPRLGVKRRE